MNYKNLMKPTKARSGPVNPDRPPTKPPTNGSGRSIDPKKKR